MKTAAAIGSAILIVAVLAFVALRPTAPSARVTSVYDTLADARSDRLFERGWLPDILPRSTVDIETNNDLDWNTSHGEFSFDAVDFQRFAGKTTHTSEMEEFDTWREEIEKSNREGHHVLFYISEGSTWVFWCNENEGHCRYSKSPTSREPTT